MPDQPPRRFTVFDGMVLVGATAIGLGHMQLVDPGDFTSLEDLWPLVFTIPLYQLLPWTIAVALLYLRKPRHARSELFRKAGFIACAATLFACFCFLVDYVFGYLGTFGFVILRSEALKEAFFFEYFQVPGFVARAIVSVWLVTALGGRWEAERSWLDRLGRAIGWSWLLLYLALEIRAIRIN